MSLLDTADMFRKEESEAGVTARAEEESGVITLTADWPVQIGDDYADFIRFFGYQTPEDFEVIDPGRMSRWQQSARSKDGDRDVVWLFSYSGVKIRRKTRQDILGEQATTSAIERVTSWRPPVRKTLGLGLGDPVTYVHAQGDEQTGAFEGGGIEGLAKREEAALEKSLDYVAKLMARGVNVEAVADLSSGDRVENIMGHYHNQPVVTATMRDQYRYAVEAEVTRLRAFADLGLPIIAPRTPSNHGEHRSGVGVSPFTSDRDNLDLQIAETVKFVLDQTPVGSQVAWHIPDDEFLTTFALSGVGMGLTHGHKIKGSGPGAISKWTLGQRDRLMFHDNFRLRLLVMGHFHHAYMEELSGTTVIMTPSLDGGSRWFTASSGQEATPGLLGFTVGEGHSMGWGHLTAL